VMSLHENGENGAIEGLWDSSQSFFFLEEYAI